jgi:alkanesulfonate monooxygenase SsuD/methylene tetrahydromethanopterin reductase-like flavin-dependent oxidoreductase (luciferase family)
VELASLADERGLDLIGIQDHPYQRRFLDTWALIATLLARTERITFFPDVANLPLRPPAVLAKAAASLDLLSGGRFELGLGAGYFWDAIAAMGGPRRAAGESVEALAEAIEVIRLLWSDEQSVSYEGSHYRLDGARPGPLPAHPLEIWLGAYRPRMLRLVGRRADGWIPSLGNSTLEDLREGNARIDEAASAAGRDPASIRRLLNVSGSITAPGAGDAGAEDSGPPAYWQERLGELRSLGFDGFAFWPAEETAEQVERLAGEVAPAVRD